ERLRARLWQEDRRRSPLRARQVVVVKPLDLLGETIPVEALHRFGDPRVKVTAPAREEAPVGALVGGGGLGGVLQGGKAARLVEKLGRLEMSQRASERLRAMTRNRLEQGKREGLADDRGNLE